MRRITLSNVGKTSPDRNSGPGAIAGRWAALSAIVAALAAASFAACGASAVGPPVPIEDLARALADALCGNIGPCCQEEGFPHDQAQCHANAEGDIRRSIENLRMQPNIAYDAAAARACVDAYAAVAKACSTGDRQYEAACDRVFVGTLQKGQPCSGGRGCAPGLICDLSSDGSTLQCVDRTELRGKPGQPCSSTCTDEGGGTSSCGGSGGAGGGGSTRVSCYTNDGLYCGDANICTALAKSGERCVTSFYCAADGFCDQGICTAKTTSGSCGDFGDGCVASSYCNVSTHHCQPRKSTGSACDPNNLEECPLTDSCRNGTCRTRTIASTKACMGDF